MKTRNKDVNDEKEIVALALMFVSVMGMAGEFSVTKSKAPHRIIVSPGMGERRFLLGIWIPGLERLIPSNRLSGVRLGFLKVWVRPSSFVMDLEGTPTIAIRLLPTPQVPAIASEVKHSELDPLRSFDTRQQLGGLATASLPVRIGCVSI